MSSFESVTVLKPANIYFNGNVTSRTVLFPNGEKKTLGIMMPGEYEFGTDQKEIMEIQSGKLSVLLAGSETWLQIDGQSEFEVPAGSKFKLKVQTITDYCCSYV
ncbi:pyrimidine/purine nucleoside phosphorylase [Leptospira sp. 201903075]|uniref:pyrimidine/purine nucleoside phosphorylase n=1 Tax=Leptospira chreensis TaxID=2810035 RepID=UPI0019662406|nr:pyrimidine/purine nucleoside phosphorylase [Leptospira chreensis]MBM9590592.1 pyrimidine/purine nucleoside phosphorylase [Leptospira chreensis]